MKLLDLFSTRRIARTRDAHWLWLLALLALLTACGGSGGSDSTNPNSCGVGDCSPQAYITTPTITTIYAGQSVSLDGSQSLPGGEISYAWQQVAGDAVTLIGANEAIARFVAPTLSTERTLRFKLVVSNGYSDSAEEISFVVKPLTVTAVASTDTAIPGIPTELRALGGDESGELNYQWEQIDVDDMQLMIEDANKAVARFTSRIVTEATTATFRVTVTNRYSATTQSDITLDLAEGVIPSITSVMPSYAAPGETVKISGSGFTGALDISFEGEQSGTPTIAIDSDVQSSDHTILIVIPESIPPGNYKIKLQNSGGFTTDKIKIRSPLEDIQFASAGTSHMCAAFGTVREAKCWGSNFSGQIGNNSTANNTSPAAVLLDTLQPLIEVDALSSGSFFTCALAKAEVYCWGTNGSGQLGNGTRTDSSTAVKVTMPANTKIAAIASGGDFQCALDVNGHVYCWGANLEGMFSTPSHVTSPTLIEGLPRASALSAGSTHACIVATDDGSIWCWGGNSHGQLGDGTSIGRHTPQRVTYNSTALTGARGLALGVEYTCANFSNGTVACWGLNSHGQLGSGTFLDSSSPSFVINRESNTLLTGITKIQSSNGHGGNAGIGGHVCAMSNLAELYCWGKNLFGQVGDGEVRNNNFATKIPTINSIRDVISGANNTCAIMQDGKMLCWGLNINGQLGYENIFDSSQALSIDNLSDVSQISVGGSGGYSSENGYGHGFTCAVTKIGNVFCWGRNTAGQTGQSSLHDNFAPLPVGGLIETTHIASGSAHSCAISRSKIFCWGDNTAGQLGQSQSGGISATPIEVPGISNPKLLSSGLSHNCVTTLKNEVFCWGGNRSAPLKVAEFPTEYEIISITSGRSHNCVLLKGGNVYCWGENKSGQLGDGTYISSDIPVKVLLPFTSGATSIDAGADHTCATGNNGAISCWGSNEDFQLGHMETSLSTPRFSTEINNAIHTSAAGFYLLFTPISYTCALISENNGSIKCWGNNSLNQSGSSTTQNHAIPNTIKGLTGVTKISSGDSHSCVVYSDGTTSCWGGISIGQLGNPPPPPRHVLDQAK